MEPQQILAKEIADPLGQTIHLIDSIQQALCFEGLHDTLQGRGIHRSESRFAYALRHVQASFANGNTKV
jgi:hypothetical protein